jgi:uncharacterized protein with beta-barrel porin domain
MKASLATTIAALTPLSLALAATGASAQSLDSFGVLAGSAITNTGPTEIYGNIGVSPGSAITGFPPGTVESPYAIYQTDTVASLAQDELTTTYNVLAARPATADLTGQDLGGLTLGPGVYNFSSTAQLTGTLTMDAHGNSNAVFIIIVGSSLTTASNSTIALINGAQGANVYFVVGSSATLGTDTSFVGNILALTSITLDTGADITCGAALARNGAVTLDTNVIYSDTYSTCVLAPVTYGSVITSPTGNQRAVDSALDKYVAGGGTLPLAYKILPLTLTSAELAAAVTQLSGEGATGVAPTGIHAMNSFMSMLFDSVTGEERIVPTPAPSPVHRGPVRALFYDEAPEAKVPSPFGSLAITPAPAPMPSRWSVWAAGYGGQVDANGDSGSGSHARSEHSFGYATGADYRVTPDTKIGFAIAGGADQFGVADGLGGGRSDLLQAAVYSVTNFGSAYIAAALAYGWNNVSTSRYVTVGGDDHLTASFDANDFAGQIEGGYRFGWLIPYASVGVQDFHTPSYAETAASGSMSTFALSYAAHDTTATRTQLGLQTENAFALDNGMTLVLNNRAAWVHEFSAAPSLDASFIALPGTNFTVVGAAEPANSLLASSRAELKFSNGFSVAGSVETQLAGGYASWYGLGQVRYTW